MFKKLFSVMSVVFFVGIFSTAMVNADPVTLASDNQAVDFDTLPDILTFQPWSTASSDLHLFFNTTYDFLEVKHEDGIKDLGIVASSAAFEGINTYDPSGATATAQPLQGHAYTFKTTDNIPVKILIQSATPTSHGAVTFIAAWNYMAGGFTISGTISGVSGPLAGVPVSLSGTVNKYEKTDDGGAYSFTGLANGPYMITAALAGYNFEPYSHNPVIAGYDLSGMSFFGTVNGGDNQTGPNKIFGNINFNGASTTKIYARAGFGDLNGIYQQIGAGFNRNGAGYYDLLSLPDGNGYYVEVFADLNNNNMPDMGSEPRIILGPYNLNSGNMQQRVDVTLQQQASQDVQASTVMVTIKGRVHLNTDMATPFGDVAISLMDPGEYGNGGDFNSYIFVASVTSNGSYSGTTPEDYNFEFAPMNVKVSYAGNPYNYQLKANKAGYKISYQGQSFIGSDASTEKYFDINLAPKPEVSIANLKISPTIISPDNDGIDDRTQISFTYKVKTNMPSGENGAIMKFVVDTNGKAGFQPMNNNIFIYTTDNRRFMKKNPTDFIDMQRPDYSKLIGPISQEQYGQFASLFDSTLDFWTDGWSMTWDGTDFFTQDFLMSWEGRDNAGNPLKNDNFAASLMVFDQQQDVDAVPNFSTSIQITIKTSVIYGLVTDANDAPLPGARIQANGPMGGSMAFSGKDGSFVVAGLRPGDFNLEISKDGYIMAQLGNSPNPGIKVTAGGATNAGTIELSQGITLSGLVNLPNPPKAGEMANPYGGGGMIFDLWGNVEVWNMNGPGWYRSDFRIPLSSTLYLSSITASYNISLEPGIYSMKIRVPGYASQDETVEIKSAGVTKDISLVKSVQARGIVSLPSLFLSTASAQEFLDETGRNNLWINLSVESFDRKSRTGTCVGFQQNDLLNGATAAEFTLDGLLKNTSYHLYVESAGTFACSKIDFYSGNPDLGTINLSFGVTLTGAIIIQDDITALMSNNNNNGDNNGGWPNGMMNMPPAGVPIQLGLRSMQDNSWNWNQVYITTISFPSIANYKVRGLSSGTYEIDLEGIGDVDVTPDAEHRTVFVGLTDTVNPSTITLKNPTGTLRGKIINNSGKTIVMNKITVMIAYPKADGGKPKFAVPDANGNFTVTDLPTGQAVIWTSEFATPPGEGNLFGIPSGNSGTSWILLNTQSGTTTYLNIDLKPASTLYIKVYGTTAMLDDIYAKTTTYTGVQSQNRMGFGLARVQSLFMRKVAEDLVSSMQQKYGFMPEVQMKMPGVKEISVTAAFSDRGSDANGTFIRFVANGLEQGVYYAYPLVNRDLYSSGNEKAVNYPYACIPSETFQLLGANETKEVVFTMSAGVSLTGSIKRPQAGVSETISVSLRKPSTGETIATTSVDFSSANSVNLTSKSFGFEKVSPGKFIIVVQAQNYKVYSNSIEVSASALALPQIELKKGASIIGSLFDETGKAVSQNVLVECWAYPFVDGSYRATNQPGVTISSETSSLGQFTLPNLPGGTYMLKITPEIGAKVNYMVTSKAGITVPESQSDVDVGTIKLKNGTSILGKVFGKGNVALSGVQVRAYPSSVQDKQGNKINATSDDKGIFSLRGLNASIKSWEVKVNVRPDDPTKFTDVQKKYGVKILVVKDITTAASVIKSGIASVFLEETNAKVQGTVVTPGGEKLIMPFQIEGLQFEDYPAALVLLQSQSDLSSGDPMSGMKIITNVDGSFEIKGLVAGKYSIKVFAKGFATYRQDITVEANKTLDVGNLALTAGLSVGGTIRTQVGTKISQSDASIVVAATKDFSKIVFGALTINPVTLEVDRYDIYGVEPGVQYYIVLVQPEFNKVFVDPGIVTVAVSSETKNVIYTQYAPNFETKSFKLTLPIKAFKDIGFTRINIPLGSSEDLIDIANLPNEIDLYYIYGYATEPLKEESITEVVTTMTTSGVLRPLSTAEEKFADNRKEFLFVYIPNGQEITNGYFQLKFTGTSSKGLTGEAEYKFYLGEDGRSEKIINPMVGGNLTLGSGDESGIDVPAGSIDDEVALTSGTKAFCAKYNNETVGATKLGKYSRKSFSSPITCFSADKPGVQLSDIYEMQVRLVSGPLATISQNTPISVKIQISTSALDYNEADLKLYNYNETTKKWDAATGTPTIDWSKFTLSLGVKHMSKFAVFYVAGGGNGGGSADAAALTMKDAYVYPNPLKGGSLTADAIYQAVAITFKKLTAEARLKIFNIAGELVFDNVKANDAAVDTLIWDTKNKSGEKVASGVYVYLLTNPKDSTDKKIGKLAIIR
ncbi:MAG: carboxypeptidase regulatory-like domain-containing protein [Elusimicrobia bacterium]|nr:carboxypeptidase regulatory-like domain-containing protein [Elusimicrobiota bacterium]